MTWQRVEENTYIDDTLVTCAEYQLFINEMQEQGKHHQPDHWTSYQFPARQSREPILGVRHSDTVSFCQWLTEKQGAEWFYRLPTKVEAEFPMELITGKLYGHYAGREFPIGYWISHTTNQPKFFWVNDAPIDARWISVHDACSNAYIRATSLDMHHNSSTSQVHSRRKRLERDIRNSHLLPSVYPLDMTVTELHVLNLPDTYWVDYWVHHAPRDMISRFHLVTDRILYSAIDRNAQLELLLTDSIDYAFGMHNNRGYSVFIDIYTLQERIAGHSPAFEGIRLVRERIK